MKIKFEFQLGDLVVLKSFPKNKADEVNKPDLTNANVQKNSGDPNKAEKEQMAFDLNNSDMPIMVVHEIAHNPNMEKLFEEQTCKQIASKTRYWCFWFSQKQCCFSSNWFYEDQITLFKKTNKEEQIHLPQIGDSADYRTTSVESLRLRKSTDSEFKKFNRFLPSKLSVKSIMPEKNPALYDQKKGILISQKTTHLVKCVWYNTCTNKFSEELLPIESLIIEWESNN